MIIEKTTTEMLKNQVFLSENMQRLYFVRSDQQVHSFSLTQNGVLLSVIGNAIHAKVADDSSLAYYSESDNNLFSLRESLLMSFEIGSTRDKLRGQVQVLYTEFSRTLDFIGVGDILINLKGKQSVNRTIQRTETFKIEMIKVVKDSSTNTGKFVSNTMIRICFKNNTLFIYKVG